MSIQAVGIKSHASFCLAINLPGCKVRHKRGEVQFAFSSSICMAPMKIDQDAKRRGAAAPKLAPCRKASARLLLASGRPPRIFRVRLATYQLRAGRAAR